MTEERRLVAVMFSDICGFTKMMGADEKMAMDVIRTNRMVHMAYLLEFDGIHVKEVGDGTIARFDSPKRAVECARCIMKAAQVEGYQLRIGIHVGEAILMNDDIYGDGVNIASRLQTASVPGGILYTSEVYHNIRNHAGLDSVSLGKFLLKNDAQPRSLYALENAPCHVPVPKQIGAKRIRKSPAIELLRSVLALSILLMISFWLGYSNAATSLSPNEYESLSNRASQSCPGSSNEDIASL